MPLAKSLTVGDAVHFTSSRYSAPLAAIVTAITPSGASRCVSLTVFPPGVSPQALHGIEHASLAAPGADAWDWPVPSAAVEL